MTINLLEMKDPYTIDHSKNVAGISLQIANKANLDIDIQILQFAALLHDIGKIGISDYVLNKPIKLSKSEYVMMQQHTILGFEAVKNLSIDKNIKDAILYHHESYDGTGYPYKLKGNDIPVVARLIKIADVYDALTTDRPYRQGFSKKEAFEIIQREKSKYDPELLKVFFKTIE
jgi:putative nucleotidyltransferase with HDIG domain